MKAYQKIAQCFDAYAICVERNNTEWQATWLETIRKVAENILPYGSGFDTNGCFIDTEKSSSDCIVIHAHYHHMNDNGYYIGWSSYVVTVKPSLAFGFTLTISGRDRNGFKDYAYDLFQEALSTEIE